MSTDIIKEIVVALKRSYNYKKKQEFSELKKAQRMIRQEVESKNPGLSRKELSKLLNADEEYKKLIIEIKSFSKKDLKFYKLLNEEIEQFKKKKVDVKDIIYFVLLKFKIK